MIRKLSLFMGFAAVVAVTNAWNDGAPRYAEKRRASAALDVLHHYELKQQYEQSAHVQTTGLEWKLEGTLESPRHSVASVSRISTAVASSGIFVPPPLPPQELETLVSLYHGMGGPDWHIKDGWMSASNPCGGDAATGDAWYGVECVKFEFSPLKNSSSHVKSIVLPQNNLKGNLPPLRGLQHTLAPHRLYQFA
jgi:hypothetical protein